jgi:hypothetical protein
LCHYHKSKKNVKAPKKGHKIKESRVVDPDLDPEPDPDPDPS